MWIDSAGVAHYTNNAYDIPDRYKIKAKPLYPEPSDTRPAQQTPQEPQKTAEAAAAPATQPAIPQPVATAPTPPSANPVSAATPAASKRRVRRPSQVEE